MAWLVPHWDWDCWAQPHAQQCEVQARHQQQADSTGRGVVSHMFRHICLQGCGTPSTGVCLLLVLLLLLSGAA